MDLIQGRLAVALSFSTVAHVSLAWVMSDHLPSTAAPAQRALTVAMTPAAPRTVLNSIAPSATAALSPALVRPIAPPAVQTIDEPDTIIAARVIDTVEVLDAALVKTRGPEHTLHARDAQPSMVAVAAQADRQLDPIPATSREIRAEPPSRPAAAHVPARESVEGEPGSGAEARARMAVAGQPGADRKALPASGNTPPEYPWPARVQGHQGRVVLSVWVSAAGEADRLAVLQSSGYPTLDRAAVQAVEGWRFQPARRGGSDAASMLYVPVVFRLDDG